MLRKTNEKSVCFPTFVVDLVKLKLKMSPESDMLLSFLTKFWYSSSIGAIYQFRFTLWAIAFHFLQGRRRKSLRKSKLIGVMRAATSKNEDPSNSTQSSRPSILLAETLLMLIDL